MDQEQAAMIPVNTADREFWLAIRAAKANQAKLLEQQRRAILAEIAAIERRWNIEPNNHTRQVRVADSDSIAGAIMVEFDTSPKV